MATSELKIVGLNELRLALRNLPAELVAEAGVIVHAQAEYAAQEIRGAYPVKSGNLREHVRVETGGDAVSATARVRNTAKHAWLFESGGKGGERHWKSGKSTGVMKVGNVFIPIAMQRRRIMEAALLDIVRRAGLHVSGAAG